MAYRRVVITGIGLVTPLGGTIDEFWDNLIAGKSGVSPIERFDVSGLSTRIAAQVLDFDPTTHVEKKVLKRMDKSQQFALVAAGKAIDDSGIDTDSIDLERAGVIIGSGVGGLETFEKQHSIILNNPLRVSPFFIPMMIADMAAGLVSIINAFNPCLIVLGGGVILGLPEYATIVERAVRENALPTAVEGLRIVMAALGDKAGVIGAAALARDKIRQAA